MRKVIVSIALLLSFGVFTSATQVSVANAAPLKVKITSTNSKKRLKVKKVLKSLTSCSETCAAKVKLTLATPLGNTTNKDSGVLEAKSIATVRFSLTRYGLKYLRTNYRKCRLKVRIRAKDVATGKVVTKKRTFRFYR